MKLINDYNKYLKIIITMHNRNFLSRIVPYYQIFKKKFNIDVSIIDSSDQPTNFNFGNIQYKYYGPNQNFFKLRNEVYKTKTKYLMLFGDDDFLIPENCIKCLEFLINNPEYSVCHGRILSFKDQLTPDINNTYQYKHFQYFKNQTFVDDRIERINKLFDNFFMLNNSIIKTEDYKKSRIIDFSKSFFSYKYSDFTRAHFYLFEGDLKVLPHVFMLRSNLRTIHDENLKKKMDINIKKNLADYLYDTLNCPNPIIQYLVKKYNYEKSKIAFFHGYVYGKYLQQRLSKELWNIPHDELKNEKKNLLNDSDVKNILSLVEKFHLKNNIEKKNYSFVKKILNKFNL